MSGRLAASVAEWNGQPAGYINVYFKADNDAFEKEGYSEIVDFGVLEKYQRLGIGSKPMDIAEQVAGEHADTVCIAVGLHSGYGNAQRKYVKRGYIPDGSGVWYAKQACKPYSACVNDDDLVLYLSKTINTHGGIWRRHDRLNIV